MTTAAEVKDVYVRITFHPIGGNLKIHTRVILSAMHHIQPQASSFKAVFGSPVLVNNSLQQKQHLVLNGPSLPVHLHCGVVGCIFQTTWEFVAFKNISTLDAESKKINNKAVRNIKEHMRAAHSGDTCAGGYIIDAPQCRGAKDRNGTSCSSTIVSTLHTGSASIAAKRKRVDEDIDSEWSSEIPVSKRSPSNSEARSLTGGSNSSAPAVGIASLGQREHAHVHDDVESTAALEDELENADANSACSESEADFQSESASEKDTRLITDSERQDALTALECKYRACQEQHALRETARKNFALDAANAGMEWTHTVPWCSRSCCDKYKASYVGDDAKLKMVATNSCSARDVDLESLAAAILCPYSMLAGLTWEVKRTSGVDAIREPMTYESGCCMDTDLADENFHSMLLMAKPLIAAFETLCEVLGDRRGESIRFDSELEKPYNGVVDLYQPKPEMAQLAQRLEDAVTRQLLTRWQSQEHSNAAVSTLMSIIVAVYSMYPEQFVSDKFKESSETFQTVAQVLCGALKRAMACQLGDGQWFSCSSPQLLTLAIRAVLPRMLYLHKTSPEEYDLTPALPALPGPKTRVSPSTSYSDVSLTQSCMGGTIVSLATISTLSVRSTMLPLLLEAPSSFWSGYISKDAAGTLAKGLMDYSLLAIGERLTMCQSSGAQIELSYQEQHSVEMTARLVSAICSAVSEIRWVAYINDTHLQAFNKLAACVPGVRVALRHLQNFRLP